LKEVIANTRKNIEKIWLFASNPNNVKHR
jgi:hypothetical protein